MTTYTDSDTTAYGADTFSNLTADMYADSLSAIDTAALLRSLPPIPEEDEPTNKETSSNKSVEEETEPKPAVKKPVVKKTETRSPTEKAKSTPKRTRSKLEPEPDQNPEYYEPKTSRPVNNKYTLAVSKAYFYDKPDIRTRRPVYLSNVNESELTASEDTNGFIYVIFFNTDREITKGWLRKVDLRRIN
jgi:serine/threonine-protein kinase